MDLIKTFGKWLYTFNNQAVLWGEPDVAGWLDKRGGTFTSWKTRFFILQGSSLFYFPAPYNIQVPLGFVPIEGSALEPAGVEEGGPQRKYCFKIKLGSQFGLAKRSVYIFAAPSKQSQEKWLDNLKFAASARADLIAHLNRSRRTGAELRFKLAKSPANLKMLEDAKRGSEGGSLQAELAKLMAQLSILQKQASDVKARTDHVEVCVMRALAIWDLYSHRLSGSENKEFRNKLAKELELSTELNEMFETKGAFMQGRRLEVLDEDARTELRSVCEKALAKVQEHEARIRVKAPRYTTEVNPYIFLENDSQFIHTSEMFTICSKSTGAKKLLALQKRAAKRGTDDGRHGRVHSTVEAAKSMASHAAGAAAHKIPDIRHEFSAVTKYIEKGKAIRMGSALRNGAGKAAFAAFSWIALGKAQLERFGPTACASSPRARSGPRPRPRPRPASAGDIAEVSRRERPISNQSEGETSDFAVRGSALDDERAGEDPDTDNDTDADTDTETESESESEPRRISTRLIK